MQLTKLKVEQLLGIMYISKVTIVKTIDGLSIPSLTYKKKNQLSKN